MSQLDPMCVTPKGLSTSLVLQLIATGAAADSKPKTLEIYAASAVWRSSPSLYDRRQQDGMIHISAMKWLSLTALLMT